MYGPQRREVVAVVVPAHHHERVAPTERRLERRELERFEGHLSPPAATYSSVFSANRSSSPPIATRAASIAGSIAARSSGVPVADLLVADEQVAVDDAELASPSSIRSSRSLPDVVDEGDAGLDDAQRPGVRVAPGDRLVGVHDRDDAARHEAVGRDPVEVAMVDDRDLAGLEPLHQVLGAPVDAGRAGDRPRAGPASAGAAVA